jgi:electron transfer flavoprotein beta subunit
MSDGRPLTIAVCIKVSPDTAQLRADSRTGAPRLDDVPYRIGTFDENALEEATRLKEKHGGKVVAVSLTAGAPPPELILRALAMGADEAYVIEDPTAEHADSLATTRILSAALKKLEGWDLILCGEGSIDAYNRQVGPRLAEALEIPVLTYATRVEAIVEAAPPLLLTVGQEINEPRFPTVLQIMGASRKPTVKWTLSDLGFREGETAAAMSGVKTLEVYAPREERRRVSIPGDSVEEMAAELARTLFEQGLVKVE